MKPGKLTVYLSLVIAIISTSSCIKDYRDGETNFSGTQPVALIAEGGLNGTAFGLAALTYPGTDSTDTATFHVNYAANNVAPTQEEFTLGIDQNALKNYNATGGLQYVILPDSDYSFTTTKVTVTKGDNFATVSVIFHPNRIDASKNYMLPISITAVPSGTIISENQGTIYYHAIGNPIAGTYEQYWSRWNATDTTGGASSPDVVAYKEDLGPVIFAPNDPTSISVTSLGTGDLDVISFTNTAGTLSDFSVNIPAISGVTSNSSGVLEAANPTTGYYRISFGYVNTSGASRVVVNEYIKQ